VSDERASPLTARVPVGPFEVSDLSRADVVQNLARLTGPPGATPARAFALHVGGLVARHDEEFVQAMDAAELVYADGSSVVLAAKAAGARHIERAATTDIGWDLLRRLTSERGTPPVVSVVGGPPGLAAQALDVLVEAGVARPGPTDHGYHTEWDSTLEMLQRHPSDVLIVGLGAPREMVWVTKHLGEFATGLVLTCGGWLGFLVGQESRAPSWMQRLSLEWVYRLLQSPSRLASRYTRGAGATFVLTVAAMLGRLRRRR
jgi:N-acetylglucosaminyldiphosphoundecaprenol N-acetyl-beta-D-mannosaminyltransferase